MKLLYYAIFLLLGFVAHTQTVDAQMLEINVIEPSYPMDFTSGSDKLYFTATDGVHGRELWCHRSSDEKTYLVKDIDPGNGGALDGTDMIVLNDVLYFTKYSSPYNNELWRSDGTESGTYLVKEIAPSYVSVYVENMVVFGNRIFFIADDGQNGREVWVSDGTPDGTHLLKDINPGTSSSNPDGFFEFNGALYFAATNPASGRELWQTDGTTAGTSIFTEIAAGGTSGVASGSSIAHNGYFYFIGYSNQNGYELWRSDGTPQGTILFKEFLPSWQGVEPGISGVSSDGFFVFTIRISNHMELWKSDGTVPGTQLLRSISNSDNFSSFENFTILNGQIFFTSKHFFGNTAIWSTDGTVDGTHPTADIYATYQTYFSNFTNCGSYFAFARANGDVVNPWKSDGTIQNTFQLSDVDLQTSTAGEISFYPFNGHVYFPAGAESLSGIEPWVTAGSEATTRQLFEINHAYYSLPYGYKGAKILNDKLVVVANNGQTSFEPFVSDGTVQGTKLIKDINPGDNGSTGLSGLQGNAFTEVGGKLFFRASPYDTTSVELYVTDGTTDGTVMTKDITPSNAGEYNQYTYSMPFNGILYFKVDDGIHGSELWRSDGTADGTYLVKDIYPGPNSGLEHSNVLETQNPGYAVMNNLLYFIAVDATGKGIWRTDGTADGTFKVISPVTDQLDILGASSTTLYYVNETSSPTWGADTVWASDGTQQGSSIVYHQPTAGSPNFRFSQIVGDALYFCAHHTTGYALFKTNGTLESTTVLKSSIPSNRYVQYMKECGDYVYFGLGENIGDGYAQELWRTDGTVPGTIQLVDGGQIPNLYSTHSYLCYEDFLFFLKSDISNEFWMTGGTMAQTYPVSINVDGVEDFGENYSGIFDLLGITGSKLFFSGVCNTGTGVELFVTNIDQALGTVDHTPSPSPTVSIIAFPNPSSKSVMLRSSTGESLVRLDLFDVYGKKIFSQQTDSAEANLDISSLEPGVYFVRSGLGQTVKIVRN